VSRLNHLENLPPWVRRSWRKKHFTKQGGKCYHCSRLCILPRRHQTGTPPPDLATLDHLIPRRLGGSLVFENFVVSCYECNQARGGKSLEEWSPHHVCDL
jgi:5-methylcytosine-specific restriction endonuclease McrA